MRRLTDLQFIEEEVAKTIAIGILRSGHNPSLANSKEQAVRGWPL